MADAVPVRRSVAVSAERMTAHIVGHVQGVGFRWWARRQAVALKLSGWVMNGNDERSVDVVAEGEPAALEELARRLRAGPSGARVESFRAKRSPASGEFDEFGIVRS